MINNELKSAVLYTYDSVLDDYGQPRRNLSTSKKIELYVKVFTQNNVTDPRYVDVELLGLTKLAISPNNIIEIDGVKYDVLYVTPSKRFNEVFLRKTSQ